MLSNNHSSMFKHAFLILMMSLFLVACDKDSEDSKGGNAEQVVPTLSNENIKNFTIKMAKDYNARLDNLMTAFNQAQKDGDAYQFVQFRNREWTPAYIEKKDYYQAVLAQNSTYLSTSSARPLFDVYENLIYIGIGLKNALLDNDKAKLQVQLEEIQKDKETVNLLAK